ncbi:type II-A CRISPR-associated protein Csn2 [Anaerococcus tetradius]|uniref:CRISPR-associated protein, Csn2 family n=1 Tax=Anaerococcus tetradius ATCC 35098 TaxID=525255 RepID=C2CKI9_9FIRM|nr:type II-A CRISPR-associated protein Csn2 [Anaerococcus tetradius]EEI81954.1 CRISPR-associated protein, Csn2 family [Anaerococcus tetradius ATCC 35098]
MILTSEYLEKSFEIKEQRLNTIVLENKIYYRKIIQAVRDTINLDLKEFVLYEDEEEVKLNKIAELITNVFNINPNDNKILAKLYEKLGQEITYEDIYCYNRNFKSALSKLLEELSMLSEYDFKYEDVDYKYIFKAVGLEIDTKFTGLMANIIEYLDISHKLLNKKIFFIVGIDDYFEERELYDLNEYLCYNDIIVICLQNRLDRDLLPNENLRIIDEDLGEI